MRRRDVDGWCPWGSRVELFDDQAIAVDGDVVQGPPAMRRERSGGFVAWILQCQNVFDRFGDGKRTEGKIETVNAARRDHDRRRCGVQPACAAE